MPLYEYVCEQDGTVIELLRPMAQADAPVPDPDNKGRVFKRAQSAFAPGGAKAGTGGKGSSLPIGGGCSCGRPHGSCGSN
jgi:predicted nucleic acid-binding Zn ribbon protein